MYLDILILIIFIFGILTGIRNGIFIEIISVFGFAINLLITKMYTPVVLRFLKRSDATFANNYVITYIVTFITVYLVVSMILVFVKKAFKGLKKGFFNKLMGGIAGFVKAFIASLVIILIYTYSSKLAPSLEKYSQGSSAIGIFYEIIPNFESYIPDILVEDFNKNATKKIIEKNINTML